MNVMSILKMDGRKEWDDTMLEDTKTLVLFSNYSIICNRQSNWIDDNTFWNEHVQPVCQLGKFERINQMSDSAFEKCLGKLHPKLHKDVTMSNKISRGFGVITNPEVTMTLGTCLLAGEDKLI